MTLASAALGPVLAVLAALLALYLWKINQLLLGTPDEIRQVAGQRWTPEQLRRVYQRLQGEPVDHTDKLPPRLERRYVVTGGSGLVGGYIVLQLLARGTPPESIRVVDIRRSERNDMGPGTAAAEVSFVQTDITSPASVRAAFAHPWADSCASLPLTVFHTAAVILASERSPRQYAFPDAVNVRGTANVLAAARDAGADVFSATSSASIAIRPVRPFVAPWASSIHGFWQVLDERDFDSNDVRPRECFFGNYPVSKAAAERLVCATNDGNGFRAGCIRPANGVYGHPTDNTVGDPLSRVALPTWVSHIVQPFVHGANVALAHLYHEAALLGAVPTASSRPQVAIGGRPFVVTDPNPPIAYADLYTAIATLSVHPFRAVRVPPVAMLILAHVVEFWADFSDLLRDCCGARIIPPPTGDIRHLKPGIFSICTHLVAAPPGSEAARISLPLAEGGLALRPEAMVTTLEGVVGEILEWNREHDVSSERDDRDEGDGGGRPGLRNRKAYTTSVSLADHIRKLRSINGAATP